MLFLISVGLFVVLFLVSSYLQAIWNRAREEELKKLLDQQSIQVNIEDNPSHDLVHRSVRCEKGLLDKPYTKDVFYATTLYDSFMNSVEKYGHLECLGHRKNGDGEYVWMTYSQVSQAATNFGSGLLQLTGLQRQNLVGIFSNNNTEWVIAERACNAYSLVSVPLYQTLGNDSIMHIIETTKLSVVVATSDHILNLLEFSQGYIKYVIVIDYKPGHLDAFQDKAKKLGIQLVGFDEILRLGENKPIKHVPPKKDDLVTISFTSGTTGKSKGAMLTHWNLISALITGDVFFEHCKEVHISYLPLAHMYERAIHVAMFHYAGRIGFFRGDPLKLLEDVSVLKPTLFASVPRIFNKIYEGVYSLLEKQGGIKKHLFNYAFQVKKNKLKYGQPCTHWLWDPIIFNRIKARLGGRVTRILSASAPISSEVMDFLRICFSCQVFEGYGQTETGGSVTLTHASECSTDHVGPPNNSCEIVLEDVPEMKYLHTDKPYPRGEILIRGHCVFKGYWMDEEKTREAIDKDGWLHTGDVGLWLPNGCLKIIDRKKNIFKTSQGEYIAPEKIENVLVTNSLVQMAFVTGDSLKSFVVAVIVPKVDNLLEYAKSQNLNGDLVELCQNKEIISHVRYELTNYCKERDLKGFEIPHEIYLESSPFSVENGLLTPTMKLKRYELSQYYAVQVKNLYSKNSKQ